MEKEPIKRVKGKITMLHEKGYGFIISPTVQFTKFFFHWTGLNQNVKFTDLKRGMNVEFTPILADNTENEVRSPSISRGPRAIKIEVI